MFLRGSFALIFVVTAVPAQNSYSVEKEVALGKALAAELDRQYKPLEDPIVTEYLNQLGQTLTRGRPLPLPLSIKVLGTADAIANALPGGYLIFSSGFLSSVKTESNLLTAMAHQMGHLEARQGLRNVSKGQRADFASIPLVFMGSWAGMCTRYPREPVLPLGFRQMSIEFEAEADRLGAERIRASGYQSAADSHQFRELKKHLAAPRQPVRKPPSLRRAGEISDAQPR